MIEFLGLAYLIVASLVFIVFAFTSERTVGRVCTGEPDFEAAFFVAILWPLFAVLAIWLLYQHKKEQSHG